MECLALFVLAVLVAESSGHDCIINCNLETGLRKEELFSTTFSYESLSQCADPTHCDDSTPGTGHKLFSALTEDLIAVERCYSFCYTNVTGGFIPEGNATLIDNIYAEPACSDKWNGVGFVDVQFTDSVVWEASGYEATLSSCSLQGHVCFSACLFGLESLFSPNEAIAALISDPNTTCSDFCTMPGGICERAFPPDVDSGCIQQCRLETCPHYCRLVERKFPPQSSTDAITYPRLSQPMPELTMDYTSNVTLKKEGVLEVQVNYVPPPPPSPTPPPSTPTPFTLPPGFTFPPGFSPPPPPPPSSPPPPASSLPSGVAYGLIWKVTYSEGGQRLSRYISQHLPFILLPDEVGPLYRIGSNMLAIRDLQCRQNVQLSFALVNVHGIGPFTTMKTQCFYGSWFPIPPNNVSTKLGFDYSTGELRLEISTRDLSPDQEYVEGYRVQIVNFPSSANCNNRLGDKHTIQNDVAFDNKDNLRLVVHGTQEVEKFFPLYNQKCNYLIGVYALPQRNRSATGRLLYAVANWKSVYVDLPDYAQIEGNTTLTVSADPITGRSDVTYTYKVTSHWSSLAVVDYVYGLLTKELTTGDTVVDSLSHHVTRYISIIPNTTVYYFRFQNVQPTKETEVYKFQRLYGFRYEGITFDITETPTFPLPSRMPSPVRNLTAAVTFDVAKSKIIANLSWIGPESPYGKIDHYKIVLSSPRAASLIGSNTLSAKDTAAAWDMSQLVETYIVSDLLEDEYFNFSVRAVSEWGAEGEWAVERVTQTLAEPVTPDNVPTYLFGIIGAIGVLVAMFLIFVGAVGCYYYRRNKVVIMKNTRVWINGRQDVEEGDDEEDDFQPVPVDNWEISPDCIIMDTMLGEGQFGEVYKGMIKDGDVNNPYCKGSEFVAVKILRPEANAALKSDFLKEIATMKKITMGNCPYVVNMVGCCTLQEPLALVLEYVPHGDLLTYMRTMRKLNSTRYFQLPPPESIQRQGNEYVNHGPSAMTPMTPASDCPLLGDRGISPPTPLPQVPSPYEKPYTALGELRPVHLVSFAYQVASGMKFLSELGIVHRDLACRNVLVGENKVLKISDFGLARENDIYIKTTDGKLPLRWMAIESIVDRVFTTKSDVWSFGVLLWEITTLGGHPYPSIGNKALLTHLLRGNRMDKPDNCSPDIYEIMKQCWVQDPISRPSFAELEARLDVILSKAQSENYIDLNVDEMLPYYSMRAVEQIDEVDEEDLQMKKNDGYPDTSNITAQGFIADIARSSSSNSDNGSITDAEVQNSQGENTDTTALTALPVDTSAKSEVKEAPPSKAELTIDVNERDM